MKSFLMMMVFIASQIPWDAPRPPLPLPMHKYVYCWDYSKGEIFACVTDDPNDWTVYYYIRFGNQYHFCVRLPVSETPYQCF